MWEPFTESSRRAILLAQEESQKQQNEFIGTEDILIGIIREEENSTSQILRDAGLKLEDVRLKVKEEIDKVRMPSMAEMTFTPGGRKIIEVAFEIARDCGHYLLERNISF